MIGFKQFVEENNLKEDMTAGDAGGNPEKIAAGETSGSITNRGPSIVGKENARRRKTVLSIIMFIVGLLSAIIGVVVFGLSGHKTKTEKLSEITMYVGVVLILLSVALK